MRTRLPNRLSVWTFVVLCLAACGGSEASRRDDDSARVEAAPATERPAAWRLPDRADPTAPLRILIIGDTGYPGAEIDRVRAAVQREKKDVILVAGDLIYPTAPACTPGRVSPDERRILDERLGGILGDLGAPALLVLGNHDVAGSARDLPRERCLLDYTSRFESLVLPAQVYVADLGVAVVSAINTNDLTDPQGVMTRDAFAAHDGWHLILGHHTLKTYHDKEHQDWVRPWLKKHALQPDVFVNGHAHVLQFGVYDGVPALTSGATAKTRERPACPGACGEGQEFGASVPGYAMLVLDGDQAVLTFHDAQGTQLFYRALQKRPRTP